MDQSIDFTPSAPASALGLTSDEARRRLEQFGHNTTADEGRTYWRRVLDKFIAPVPLLLEATILLQLALGETIQGAVIAILLVFNAALGFFQESRAQATLTALKSRLALMASVRRDGVWQIIHAADLVPGDIVKLSLGHVVAADTRLLEGEVLLDQSMLTGESLPIEASQGYLALAGALVRRGEAVGEVTATGARTASGRTAELIRTASVPSSQQKAVFSLVRNLALVSIGAVFVQLGYAWYMDLGQSDIIALTLTALLAAIPIALPASFTLTSALAARSLARQDVLPTRLSAVDEAGSMDVLCADKTGTLTRNELAVSRIVPIGDHKSDIVLGMAALASSDGGQDPVDAAIRAAAMQESAAAMPQRTHFKPFDPATKMAEAVAKDENGKDLRIVKGAYAVIASLARSTAAQQTAEALEAEGFRVLAVAVGAAETLQIIGLIALSDPPREDSARLIAELKSMGIETVMVTGDAPATAAVVARAIGLSDTVSSARPVEGAANADGFGVYAGILPEDKYHIVQALQRAGHIVGMCGDGANDAPALRQAQIGIAVATATDVAKSAAGIVLTTPGLGGIVAAVHQGRHTFQRILTYTVGMVTRKVNQMLFLTIGLMISGHAILTPGLMVLLMTTGDFLALTASTDNVRESPVPNRWRISNVTAVGVALGLCDLCFCSGTLAVGKFILGFGTEQLQTLTAVVMVFSGQAIMYVARERRRLWRSWPSKWLALSSTTDLAFIATLAGFGWILNPIPPPAILAVLVAAMGFALVIDQVKVTLFRRFQIV
jgi:H+-transporting ATPase